MDQSGEFNTLEENKRALTTDLMPVCFFDVPGLCDRLLSDTAIGFNPSEVLEKLKGKGVYNESKKRWVEWPDTCNPGKEREIASFLNKLAGAVRSVVQGEKKEKGSDLIYSARYKDIPVEGPYLRRPDLIICPSSTPKAIETPWEWFVTVGEVKSNALSKPRNTTLQLAEYVQLMFRYQPFRRFVPTIGFFNDNVSLHVFDRAGVVVSPQFNANSDPETFLRVAIGILLADKPYLGYDPTFNVGEKCITVKGIVYSQIEDIFSDRTIRGRGTNISKGIRKDRKDPESVVIKDSWVDRSRHIKEYEVLEAIKGIDGVTQLVAHEIVQVPDASQPDTTVRVNDSTEGIRMNAPDEAKDEVRDHHRIVMKPYGDLLEDFSCLRELLSAMKDYVKVILDLYEKKKVLHRDISLRNLVLVGQEGLIRKGYIIDFDSAIMDLECFRSALSGRYGTVPYMAFEVLLKEYNPNFKHKVYYDLESLLYVLIWISVTRCEVRGVTRQDMDDFKFSKTDLYEWDPAEVNEKVLKSIGQSKRTTMTVSLAFKSEVLDKMHPYFEPLKKCLEDLRVVFFPSSEDGFKAGKAALAAGTEPDLLSYYPLSARPLGMICTQIIKVLDETLQIAQIQNEVPRPAKSKDGEGHGGETVGDAVRTKATSTDNEEENGKKDEKQPSSRMESELKIEVRQMDTQDEIPVRTSAFGNGRSSKKRPHEDSGTSFHDSGYGSSNTETSKGLKAMRTNHKDEAIITKP